MVEGIGRAWRTLQSLHWGGAALLLAAGGVIVWLVCLLARKELARVVRQERAELLAKFGIVEHEREARPCKPKR